MSLKREFTLLVAERRKRILQSYIKEDESFLLDSNGEDEILDELMGSGVYTEDLDSTVDQIIGEGLLDEALLHRTLEPVAKTLWKKAEKLQESSEESDI